MRKPTLLLYLLVLGATMSYAQAPTDTTRQWQVRTPLSTEEEERRAAERAELEAMKARFRAYTEEVRTNETERRETNGDFLWSEGETGGATSPPAVENPEQPPNKAAEEEELRLEIGRQLQYGKSPNAVPPAPLHPSYSEEIPTDYDSTPATDWQADIQQAFQAKGGTPSTTPVLDQLVNGQIFTLEQLQFDPLAPTQLLAASATPLQTWTDFLRQYPGVIVEVRAHLAAGVNELTAIDQSVQRAKNIATYLTEKGVPPHQVRHSGWGSSSPLVPANSPGGSEKNERIELVILEIPAR
ncbi:MAG: OmpA family protein [Bacteroidota bacterium]